MRLLAVLPPPLLGSTSEEVKLGPSDSDWASPAPARTPLPSSSASLFLRLGQMGKCPETWEKARGVQGAGDLTGEEIKRD